tara:strand:- start:378 stop:944 length:567 start_codon:yes stop_codon:yes gene_type:complete
MRGFILCLFIFLFSINLFAQDNVVIMPFSIHEGDTFFTADISEVKILSFKDNIERRQYYILKRKVLKVYPYALAAKEKLEILKRELDSIPKSRKKKRYTKLVAKWVKQEYSNQLKQLTMSEGRILVKLIYRETNSTSYDILRSYRGRFNAFFWQTMAKMWDNNLKTQYDPLNNREDMLIEHIIISTQK